jgi:hypothetical protein
VSLDGEITLPFDEQEHSIRMRVAGEDLSDLSPKDGPVLPSVGPYELAATLDVTPSGYALTDASVRLGSSRVEGEARVRTTGDRRRADIAVLSGRIQLDDLALDEWAGSADDTPRADQGDAGGRILRHAFREWDGSVDLDVRELWSGGDRLGGGHVRAALEAQHLEVAPFRVELPGGALNVSLDYRQGDTGVTAEVRARIDQFDYGVLARRIDTNATDSGRIDLDLRLAAAAASPTQLLSGASGHLAVAVWPEGLGGEVFDLWAANLVTALLPVLDTSSGSRVNCIAGAFEVENGLLTDRVLLIDTTRVRVSARGRIDLKAEALDLFFRPRAKRPAFFSLQTPVGVSGSFDKPRIEVSGWEITKSVFRFVTSIVVVPFQRIFTQPMPKEGGEEVARIMRQTLMEMLADGDSP